LRSDRKGERTVCMSEAVSALTGLSVRDVLEHETPRVTSRSQVVLARGNRLRSSIRVTCGYVSFPDEIDRARRFLRTRPRAFLKARRRAALERMHKRGVRI
jgi:hypothetical protein